MLEEETAPQSESVPDLKTIAVHAGVSVSSVSRVLNNVGPVSEEVKSRVHAAVAELGRPKSIRNSGRASWAVYIVTPDDLNPYFYEIIHGAVAEAARVGHVVSHFSIPENPEMRDSFWKWLRREPSVGGIVMFAGMLSNSAMETFSKQVDRPLVVMHHWSDVHDIPTIKIDYVESMKRTTQHLIDLEHRRFAFLAGTLNTPDGVSPIIEEKHEGILRALRGAELSLLQEHVLEGPPTIDWGFQAMKQLLSIPPEARPTAVLCSNDLVAFGALHAIRSSDLVVPRDVSVVGFDDIAMAVHSNPPLTTVAAPKRRMGRLAVELILRLRENLGTHLNEYYMLESPLVVRESTGKAPK